MNEHDRHYPLVARRLADGDVIPFLGAGANLCDRPEEESWAPGRFLPSGGELARVLAESSAYPDPDDADLLRISQYVDAVLGERDLYRSLHAVFDADYPPSSLHRLLARLPALIREHGGRNQLVVLTTNYDDLAEQALEDAHESFDVVWYEAKPGPAQGCFMHRPHGREPVLIDVPNEYIDLATRQPVVVKLHGAIARGRPDDDSYVVTEDGYVDYLAGRDVGEQIPLGIRRRIADSHFLFLGYSMRDWNLRVILNRIWGARQLDLKSWAVQREPATAAAREIEEALWRDRGEVELLYRELKDYVAGLEAALADVAAP